MIFQTDSQLAANLILNLNTSESHYLYPLIGSCMPKLTALHYELKHIFREGNFCADTLAKKTLFDKNDLLIFDVLPPYLILDFGNDLV